MQIKTLFTGSSGNCTLIKNDTTQILIEAGVPFVKVDEKLENKSIDAIFISHEHGDHIKCAGVLGRKFNCPIYLPEMCYEKKQDLFKNCNIHFINGGDTIDIKDFSLKIFSTRHDAVASVDFTITDKLSNKKFGYLTDTGAYTKLIRDELQGCDAYLLECDYDEEELDKCDYEDELKARIMSPWGHLSNQKTLDFVKETMDMEKVGGILLAHLSQKSNSPEIVRKRISERFEQRFLDKFIIAPAEINL